MKFKKPKSPISKVKSSVKRSVNKTVVPGYGKGGATALSNPKKYVKKRLLGQPLSKKRKKGLLSLFK
ncbi:hypothetical protein H8S33_13620 [Ornithinibacillus sp. BX22]|uniref:Uncharacterized protein n=2 Tax=Ornithinibacillus TaxID=484508 RepID=A0A923L7C6_9BACI|nr:hypothetical protein [Ornithinibacillus hominis]MBS3681793.1 hypothetical protein [Ornithinibacillus massiliensis]